MRNHLAVIASLWRQPNRWSKPMTHPVRVRKPLSSPWPGADPFLFIAHHTDHYPASDGAQGVPAALRAGRDGQSDFSGRNGFSLYHAAPVPGFPAHPHRGFETVTIVEQGLVDHADSLGATARYGDGDVQWLTAGAGVMHAEMFPLRHADADNPLDLYQIWLNLPPEDKMVPPAFTMLWAPAIPLYRHGPDNAQATVKVIAGRYTPVEGGPAIVPPSPAPDSWAAKEANEVAIWRVSLAPGARLTLPGAAGASTLRTLYFHKGQQLQVAGQRSFGPELLEVDATAALELFNDGSDTAVVMVLQGAPIGAPVAAMGPFVMNTEAELQQARRDFGRTQFGGWPWPASGPVHPAGETRFARHPGSERIERPDH
jgi:redox-sensitive bicupin YhaK (pirin superfamily)